MKLKIWLSALGMALAPMTGNYTAVLLTETLFTFLVTLGVFLWGRGRFIWTGIAFGLAILTRPVMLPFVLVLPVLTLLPAMRRQRRAYILIAVMAVAEASVWIVRNAIVFHRFIPVAASGWGTNLLCGTIETSFVGGWVRTSGAWTSLELDQNPITRVDAGLDEVAADHERMRRAIDRIAQAPSGWIAVRAKQYPRLFLESGDYLLGSHSRPLAEALREGRLLVVVTKFGFMLGNLIVIALGLCGMFLERRRFVWLSHITLFPVYLSVVHLPVWVEPRYSLPMMPEVAILTAVGLVWLIKTTSAYKLVSNT